MPDAAIGRDARRLERVGRGRELLPGLRRRLGVEASLLEQRLVVVPDDTLAADGHAGERGRVGGIDDAAGPAGQLLAERAPVGLGGRHEGVEHRRVIQAWQHLHDVAELTGAGTRRGGGHEVAERHRVERHRHAGIRLLECDASRLEALAEAGGQVGHIPAEERDLPGGLLRARGAGHRGGQEDGRREGPAQPRGPATHVASADQGRARSVRQHGLLLPRCDRGRERFQPVAGTG